MCELLKSDLILLHSKELTGREYLGGSGQLRLLEVIKVVSDGRFELRGKEVSVAGYHSALDWLLYLEGALEASYLDSHLETRLRKIDSF